MPEWLLDFLAVIIPALAWPFVVIIVALLFRKPITNLFSRDNMKIKVGSLEVSFAEAAKIANEGMVDISGRLAKIEKFFDDATQKDITETDIGFHKNKDNSIEFRGHKKSDKVKYLLWVDDYPSNNAFIIERLAQEGVDVTIKTSTKEALDSLIIKEFDAIISDLGRQENGRDNPIAGLEFVQMTRKKGIDTPIIIFSGGRAKNMRHELIHAGAENATNSSVELFHFLEKHIGIKF